MEAIILAGGLGTRLRGCIGDLPKCMAEINRKPFLFYLHRQLMKAGVDRVIHALGYGHQQVIKYLHEAANSVITYDYVIEQQPLGTGGGIQLALQQCLQQDILVVNGDTFFDIPLRDFMQKHQNAQAATSLGLKPLKQFERYGSVLLKEDKIVRFEEKKYTECGLINGGLYALNKENFLQQNLPVAFSFETDYLLPKVSEVSMHGFVYNHYFIDIGIPEDYEKAQHDLR